MTDKEKILSPDYIEILSDFVQPEGVDRMVRDYVYLPIDSNLGITYINREEVRDLGLREFTYRTIPKA